MMRILRLASLSLVSMLVVAIAVTSRAEAGVQDFTINNFTADYYLTRDDNKTSQLKVVEVIEVNFPNANQNHGIERAIPNSYQDHTVSLNIGSVTDLTGKPYEYSTKKQNDNTVLQIGNKNSYVYGLNTYKITYTLKNVINFQKNDEFYWDVNGDQSMQSIPLVTGRIHLPQSLSDSLTGRQECFADEIKSEPKKCTISKGESLDETIITTQTNNIAPYKSLTFDIEFKKNTFAMGPEVASEKANMRLILISSVITVLILPLFAFIYMYRKWKTSGEDPKGKGVIIPEYVAPKGLNVINSGFILEQKLAPKMMSAGIIQLAIEGYIQISEIETKSFLSKKVDYELKLIKDIRNLSSEQQDLVKGVFSTTEINATIKISSLKNKLASTLSSLNTYLAENLAINQFFTSNPTKVLTKYTTSGLVLLVVSFIGFFILPLGLGLFLASIIVLLFARIMPSRTQKGVETRDYLLGLKEYIKLAEADRIKYLQSPKGVEKKSIDPNNPKQLIKLFEDLLPYAMLFGLEKDWAKEFKDLYTEPPSWYTSNHNGFNAIYLSSAITNFNSASSNVFTAPSSSGSSGFGGGGFSGGGGGGGGVGGW